MLAGWIVQYATTVCMYVCVWMGGDVVMWMGQWLSSGSERTERRKRQREGNRAIRSRMRMGMDGNERSVQGDSASPVRGACSRGMAWYSTAPPTYTRPSQRYPTHTPSTPTQADNRVQQTLFRAGRYQRRQHRLPGVASASDSSMGALRHGGRWESGQRLELELACAAIPACATTAC